MTAAPVPVAALRAVTRIVEDGGADLLDHLTPDGFAWLHDDVGLVTAGVAARVEPRHAAELLAGIEHDAELDDPATGPVAVGALPFDPDAPALLVVPRRIVGRLPDGRRWITQLGPSVQAPVERVAAPRAFTLDERTDRAEWRAMVDAALAAIDRRELEKVVLARRVDVHADRPFDVRTIVARLRDQQPGCFVYAAEHLVGATPELLVRRRGDHVESRPMAGTFIGRDDGASTRPDASEKDTREHEPVPRAIADGLRPWCTDLDVPTAPRVERFASISHLVSPVTGRLAPSAPDACVLATSLHPTPAVGGVPRADALRTIAALEADDRGRYAGPVGWVDARGDGDWGVALRGAVIDGRRASLHAGAGIVAGSDPEAEWFETAAKLEPMLRALGVR